jgi:hypothetical protein
MCSPVSHARWEQWSVADVEREVETHPRHRRLMLVIAVLCHVNVSDEFSIAITCRYRCRQCLLLRGALIRCWTPFQRPSPQR